MRLLNHVIGIVAGSALLASAVLATTLAHVSPSQAVDQAELIFTGRVVEVEFVASGDGRYPFTFVTFEVLETFKGEVRGNEITLRLDGGDLPAAEESVEVVGMPTFEKGEESLLFVAGNGKRGCPIIGWWQGRLDLVPHPSTGETLLLSHGGTPVEGLTGTGWSTADVRYDRAEKRLLDVESESRLLWQQGVTIVESEAPSKARSYVGVKADSVLTELRSLVSKRRLQKSFVAERLVESADPYDVPESVHFSPSSR